MNVTENINIVRHVFVTDQFSQNIKENSQISVAVWNLTQISYDIPISAAIKYWSQWKYSKNLVATSTCFSIAICISNNTSLTYLKYVYSLRLRHGKVDLSFFCSKIKWILLH